MTNVRFESSRSVHTVLCDLDGVVWLARTPVPGSVDAVARLRAAGIRVLFVTNNSVARLADHEAALAAIGITAEGDVLSSAQAAALLVSAGERVLLCADAGVAEAVAARGAVVVDDDPCDVVVVGLHRRFDYERLRRASGAVRRGARFVGTNDDATFPTPDGMVPGAGALVAAVATAAGVEPRLAGKPHGPMAELVRATLGPTFDPATTLVVGDRASTDGTFARVLGCRFALVRTGVAAPGELVRHDGRQPWLDVPDLATVARHLVRADGAMVPSMANSTIEKLIDAGVQFTEMTKKQAEDLVSRLVKAGEVQRQEAERTVQMLVDRGRETSSRITELIQAEVSRQTERFNDQIEILQQQYDHLAARVGAPTRSKKAAAKRTTAKKSTAKKSTAKRSTAKKTAAKKSTAKRSTAKTTAAKTTAAKKTAAKKATARKSTAKKTAAKKTAAKKTAGSSGAATVSPAQGS